ncbi:MAG: phospholipid carrier-dependent glycosyltransferase [Chloroflexi bacterium]|nr:phospholipid carrier-dependent glycosyltransferase [Chloroflexota bacterium]
MAKSTRERKVAKGLRVDWSRVLLALMLVVGFGLRMIDLTDPPMDFHPTRQYRDALIARSLYYQISTSEDLERQEQALGMRAQVAELEPPIMESVVAAGYALAGGEQLWIARVISSLVWVLGGWALYALAARATRRDAAILGLGYYLFLPFSVIASRSFQPDPLLVALMALASYAAFRWSEEKDDAQGQGWKWAILTGMAAGLAVLVKATGLYFMVGLLLSVVLATLGWRKALPNRQVWVMAALAVLPGALFYLGRSGDSTGSYVQNWIVALLPLAFKPSFYVRWLNFLGSFLGLTALFAGLAGVLLGRGVYRWTLVGLWSGYALYSVTLPHQTLTHNYNHLPLVLLIALSLAPLFEVLLGALRAQGKAWRWMFVGLAVAAMAFNGWIARSTLLGVDYQHEADYWAAVGDALPEDGKIIGLVQQYGHPLTYYGWRNVALWPVTGDLRLAELRGNNSETFETIFAERTEGMDYFLVTTFNQLEQQAQLNAMLYGRYPILIDGGSYIVFDLRGEG